METVSVRDLRNRGGDILTRVSRGETVVVTRDGAEVAQLSPLPAAPLPTAELVARWRRLPPLDAAALRDDIDTVLDQSL